MLVLCDTRMAVHPPEQMSRIRFRLFCTKEASPVANASSTMKMSGSMAVAGAKARTARAARIVVEGVHDAELVERVWGDDLRIEGVVVERTSIDSAGSAVGTGETFTLPAQLIVRSVGYRGTPIDDVPFDSRRNVIPNDEGRVLPDTGVPIKGLYVAGWIKRGPSGIIGTNKKDAAATVASLLLDLSEEEPKGGDGITALLADRGIVPIDVAGWQRIDAAEQALGAANGRDRTTIHTTEALQAAAHS